MQRTRGNCCISFGRSLFHFRRSLLLEKIRRAIAFVGKKKKCDRSFFAGAIAARAIIALFCICNKCERIEIVEMDQRESPI
jgi:hypothetical protein